MGALRLVFSAVLLLAAPCIALADLDTNTKPPAGIQTTTATLADVLALNEKASGKPLDAFSSRIEEYSYRSGGNDVTLHTVWKGRDFKSTITRGPIVSQQGRIAGVHWRQNNNGLVVINGGVHPEFEDFEETMSAWRAGKPGDAVKLLGEVPSPVAAYVVQVQPAGDPPQWLFYDKASGLLVREESVFDGVRTTTTYSEFKTFSGSVVPTLESSTNGEPAFDTQTQLKSLRLDEPVPGAEVNIPTSRQNLVQFPPQATSVKLPAKMPMPGSVTRLADRDYELPVGALRDHITVRVTINGRGLDFYLDSGASGILINKEVADQLGLKQYDACCQLYGGPAGAAYAIVPEMRIGDLTMKNFVAYARPFSSQAYEPEKVVGLLGFDFIASVGLKVDWDKGEVVAFAPGSMPMPATSVTVPIRLDDLVPDIDVSLGNLNSEHFILDTGSSTVLIFPDFAAKHPAELADQGLGRELRLYIPDLYLGTVGGVEKAYPVQVKRLNFGVPFSEFIVLVVDPESRFGFQDTDGLIGYNFLHYFNLYFDYAGSRIVLEPDMDFQRARHIPQK
jgi:hypothetical protein